LTTRLRYRRLVSDGWNLRILTEHWSGELWYEVLSHLRQHRPRRHPQTVVLNVEKSGRERLFLKIFHPANKVGLKDRFRDSKAFRFLKQGLALSEAGFLTPVTLAAGEERRLGFLRQAFVVTIGIEGAPLPVFLAERCRSGADGFSIREKRNALRSLAQQVRRFHDLGFVHGDLVPSNILACRDNGDNLLFYFMDNDRTRRYPSWLPQGLWKRNLVQLNRMPLASISLQDRMRFFREYCGAKYSTAANRRLLLWLETKTRRRRAECDAIDAEMSFRRLMIWQER
jgi:serine/threonine protein kinase